MSAQYIFRLDDISYDMNFENFCKIRDLFFKYNIKPIIGVIPCNKDKKLKSQVGAELITQEYFWDMIKELQHKGWSISLHGFDHVYISRDSGIFMRNDRAEFAGLPYDIQELKIREGKKILEGHGLSITSFMAPAHSLDWNTVKALLQNGISCITDGKTAFPYHKKGMFFVPQIWPWPRRKIVGIQTVCLHINLWDEVSFKMLENRLKTMKNIITFEDVLANEKKYDGLIYKTINILSKVYYPLEGKIILALSKIKHFLIRK